MSHQFQVTIEHTTSTYAVEGELSWGTHQVLLDQEQDLTQQAAWANQGYSIIPLLKKADFQLVKTFITQFIQQKIEHILGKTIHNFSLEQYHHFVDHQTHLTLVKETAKGYPFQDLPLATEQLLVSLSAACNTKLRLGNPNFPNMDVFCIRLVRPNQANDFNPPHKDAYLDRLKHAINGYLPIAGSTLQSSLPLLPKSHLLPESAIYRSQPQAIVNQTMYSVPCVAAIKGDFKMIRPNPADGELMLFSPYLIHGGGSNEQQDTTRVSLELRFWKA